MTIQFIIIYYFANLCLQGIVMCDYLFSNSGRESSSTLLFFRALCDLGVACRFIFYQQINQQVCHADDCYVNGNFMYILTMLN